MKPSILFLHGAGFTGAWWSPQLAALGADYAVGAPDLPGHGALADQPFSVAGALARIDAELDGPLAPPAIIVGISLGGYLAMSYAARRAQKVAGLVLSGCALNLSGVTGLLFKLTGAMLRLRGDDWLTAANLRSFRKRVAPELGEPIIAAGFHPASATASFFALSGTNYHRALATYPGPILLLNGEDDTPNRDAEPKFLRAAPHAQSSPIAGAGHLTNLEQPEAFSAAVARFAANL